MHRGQTYLRASHSQLCYICYFFAAVISRRDSENNGFLAGVPLLPPPSRAVSRPYSLPLPSRTPATQAIMLYVLRRFFFFAYFCRTVQSIKRYPFVSFAGSKHLLDSQRYFMSRLVTVFRPVSDRKRNKKDPAGNL